MSRFAYQPLNEKYARISQTGQLIMGRQDGHISVNKNGIILSKTKEIEDKIEDINELKYDTDEQEDVISNLTDDFKSFLEKEYFETEKTQMEVYVLDKKLLKRTEYLFETKLAGERRLDRISSIIDEYIRANDLQKFRMNEMEEEAPKALEEIGEMAYANDQYDEIMEYKLKYA